MSPAAMPGSAGSRPPTPLRLLVVDEAIGHGGVERVVLELLPELAKQSERLVWMIPNHRRADLPARLPEQTVIGTETALPLPGERSVAAQRCFQALSRRLRPFSSRLGKALERRASESRLRTLIARHGITHLFYPALFRQPFPRVGPPVFAVVHDTHYHPSWREDCLGNLRDWNRRAARLVAISRHTFSEASAVVAPEPFRAATIPNACPQRKSFAFQPPPSGPDRFPLVYCPASFAPHKNQLGLLRALLRLHGEGLRFRAVFSGPGTEQMLGEAPLPYPVLEEARQLVAQAPPAFRTAIAACGLVGFDEVERWYAEADLVALPSQCEGFGLPLAEAVGRGRRVVCSDIPAFREQIALYGFGEAVRFPADPSPEAWATALRDALAAGPEFPYSPEGLRDRFSRWTWTDAAAKYRAVFAGQD